MIGFIKKFINSDFTKPLNTLIDEVKATLALIKAKTDTITASVITQAQANNLDATISSRQANAGLTTTHADRIDASISSRATNDGVWTADGRTLSHTKPSSIAKLSVVSERTGNPVTYKFLMKTVGTVAIFFDIGAVSGSSVPTNVRVTVNGIENYFTSVTANMTNYISHTISSIPVFSGVVEVIFAGSGSNVKVKNFKVMYDYDNVDTPTRL